MTSRTPPICADCRWFSERSRHRAARCIHPDTAQFEHIYGRHHIAARDARGAKGCCGPDGNLWEQTPAPPVIDKLRDNWTFVGFAIAAFLLAAFWMR